MGSSKSLVSQEGHIGNPQNFSLGLFIGWVQEFHSLFRFLIGPGFIVEIMTIVDPTFYIEHRHSFTRRINTCDSSPSV